MKTYGAMARGIALMHKVDRWTEADWYDAETGILAMKDGRRYRERREDPQPGTARPCGEDCA